MDPKGALSFHKIPTLISSLRQITPLHFSLPISWRTSHVSLGLPSGLFPSGLPNRSLHAPFFSQIRATCLAHLTILYFLKRIIFGEEHRSWSSSLCSLLHSPFTSSLLDLINSINTLFSNTLNPCSSLIMTDQESHLSETEDVVILLNISG